MITKIVWNLHNHCISECSYCPSQIRGGLLEHSITEYTEVALELIAHYRSLGRKIHWTFNGGEPLDLIDFPVLLRVCNENDGKIELHTNGGHLWLDWWAMEPRIDVLNLSYHYWQQYPLIKFIIQSFQKSQKKINVIVPIRPDYFEEDLERALDVENEFGITVSKSILYHNASTIGGMFSYTEQQLRIMRGEDLVNEQRYFKSTTHEQRHKDTYTLNPSYTGMLCNIGIESLNISHLGWVSGSECNNNPLGNIWINIKHSFSDAEKQQNNLNRLRLPTEPDKCLMVACISKSDQTIMKFNR
jgi:MoaA/NifB/PqqE/SkfB family radical SAM enzyme